MAEQEVIKHTKKVFGLWATNNPIWHKVSEFLIEIVIIVFAITVSIYFHDRSELKHQRHETKEFLLGLREDLRTDTLEMKQDKQSFENSQKIFMYISTRKINEPLNPDTIRKYYGWIFNTTGLVPNSGRFEGFKSSGKIGTIENKNLQNNILDLYQENIPNLIGSTNFYTAKKQKLFEYVADNTKRITDSTNNLLDILTSDRAYNICRTLTFTQEILNRYDTCITKMTAILRDINTQYGSEK
ncbi:MAG TPA: hypothetical protein VGQ04_21830 [Chitinophagaceae bacterium]|jgi:hypothetical protein|nr:hypothetical protein [Chitinophagaceae bacterium]